jgi:hypothetical protein
VHSAFAFLQEPTERPYGIKALFRDDSGNWFSLNQHKRMVAERIVEWANDVIRVVTPCGG